MRPTPRGTAPDPPPRAAGEIAVAHALGDPRLLVQLRRVLIVAIFTGVPSIIAHAAVVGPEDAVVRWGYPPLVVYLLVYAWVLLRQPALTIPFSRATLLLLDVAWVVAIGVRVSQAPDAATAWASLFPTSFMGVVVFVLVGFLYFDTRDAMRHAGVLGGATVVTGALTLSEHPDAAGYLVDLLRYGIYLLVISMLLLVLSRARARLALADVQVRSARDEAVRLREAAYRDDLTGLANRRRALEELTFQATQVGPDSPVGVVYFDLDHFKDVNDRFGHQAGDRVLQVVADVATSVVRTGDLVARLGGEEFVVVAPGSDRRDTVALAERLRGVLAEELLLTLGAPVTASFGVVDLHHGERPEEALHRVDALMYDAKSRGRDRVTEDAAPQA